MEEDTEIEIVININKSENKIYISEVNSSGCVYNYSKKSDLKNAFNDYITDYLCL